MTPIVVEVVVWIVGCCECLFSSIHFTTTTRLCHQHMHIGDNYMDVFDLPQSRNDESN